MKKGYDGENLVCEHLKRKGYTILKRNFTVRGGEIDIIAENRKYILFVEVKSRGENSFASAAQSVLVAQRLRISKAAQIYLQSYFGGKQPRFDVACVEKNDGKLVLSDYFENAFDMSGGVI